MVDCVVCESQVEISISDPLLCGEGQCVAFFVFSNNNSFGERFVARSPPNIRCGRWTHGCLTFSPRVQKLLRYEPTTSRDVSMFQTSWVKTQKESVSQATPVIRFKKFDHISLKNSAVRNYVLLLLTNTLLSLSLSWPVLLYTTCYYHRSLLSPSKISLLSLVVHSNSIINNQITFQSTKITDLLLVV